MTRTKSRRRRTRKKAWFQRSESWLRKLIKGLPAWSPTVRDRFGVFVAARAAGATVELPLLAGEVIRTPNRQPMTALDRLRGALKSLPPGATAALQMQRDQKLLVGRFYP